jgi:hypothetical protein
VGLGVINIEKKNDTEKPRAMEVYSKMILVNSHKVSATQVSNDK